MISSEDFNILNENEYELINGNFSVIELEKNNNIIMDLTVDVVDKNIIKVFCKKDQNNNEVDQCKMLFLKFQNFPDGIFLEVTDSLITCHIYELKKSPTSSKNLDKISKQFLNAKFHLISFFTIIGIDLSNIIYKYNVGYVDELNIQAKFNMQNSPKLIPGEAATLPRHIKDWVDSKLSFTIGKHIFEENIIKLHMNFSHENARGKKIYRKDMSLQ